MEYFFDFPMERGFKVPMEKNIDIPMGIDFDIPMRTVCTKVGPARHPSLTDPTVPLPLTLGLGFEMLLVYDRQAAKAKYGLTGPALRLVDVDYGPILMVTEALRDAGVDVCAKPEKDDLHDHDEFDDDDHGEDDDDDHGEGDDDEKRYTRWEVGWNLHPYDERRMPDDDISGPKWTDSEFMDYYREKREYGFFELALKSPKYVCDESDGWQDDVRHTLKMLHERFDDREFGDCYRLYVHDMTGLSVHVGVGTQTQRYSLPMKSIKSFLQLVTGFERVTDELHAVNRIDSRGYIPASYSWTIPDSVLPWNTTLRWCEEIEEYVDFDEVWIYDLLAYNLENIVVHEDGTLCGACKGTIKFNQHRGTLDADEAIAWVEVAMSMVRFAHKTALRGDMLAIVKEHVYDPKMGFDGFLRTIGVADKTVDYYGMWLTAGLDCDARDQSGIHSKRVEQLERRELRGSRLNALTHNLARRRQQHKNPVEVMRAIILRLKLGDYGVPDEEVRRLLQEKYPGVGAAWPDYKWWR